MNVYLFFDPRARPLDLAGSIMPGAYLSFFLSGTDTPTPVYADAGLVTSLGTTVTADGDGRFPALYMDPEVTYRVQLFNALNVLQYDVDPYTPPRDYAPGTVLMFFGDAAARDVAYPVLLWAVCDGANGTPDMRDRFPMGVSASNNVGDTGGGLATITDAGGDHTHTGSTGATALDATQMPVHHHRLYCWIGNGSDGEHDSVSRPAGAGIGGQRLDQPSGGSFGYAQYAKTSDSTLQLVEDTGAGTPATHLHSISASGTHTHGISGSGLPPWLSIWFIMRRFPL